MPVPLEQVDEVWLAMEQSLSAFLREGHTGTHNVTSCMSCYSVTLLKRGMDKYLERGRPTAPTDGSS